MSILLKISIILVCFTYVVLDKPKIRRPSSRLLRVRKGDEVQSKLLYGGSPDTHVRWKFNDKDLKNGKDVKVVNDKGKSILTIKNATRKHNGLYRMFAENEDGEDEALIRVVVLDVPDKPQKPVASITSKKKAKLRWSPPLHDGNSPITFYRVEKMLSHRSWATVGETPDLEMEITNILPGTDVVIRLLAVNEQGLSKPMLLKFKFQIQPTSGPLTESPNTGTPGTGGSFPPGHFTGLGSPNPSGAPTVLGSTAPSNPPSVPGSVKPPESSTVLGSPVPPGPSTILGSPGPPIPPTVLGSPGPPIPPTVLGSPAPPKPFTVLGSIAPSGAPTVLGSIAPSVVPTVLGSIGPFKPSTVLGGIAPSGVPTVVGNTVRPGTMLGSIAPSGVPTVFGTTGFNGVPGVGGVGTWVGAPNPGAIVPGGNAFPIVTPAPGGGQGASAPGAVAAVGGQGVTGSGAAAAAAGPGASAVAYGGQGATAVAYGGQGVTGPGAAAAAAGPGAAAAANVVTPVSVELKEQNQQNQQVAAQPAAGGGATFMDGGNRMQLVETMQNQPGELKDQNQQNQQAQFGEPMQNQPGAAPMAHNDLGGQPNQRNQPANAQKWMKYKNHVYNIYDRYNYEPKKNLKNGFKRNASGFKNGKKGLRYVSVSYFIFNV